MRTLDEIVAAARLNEELDADDARYAIVAFDVLLSQLNLDQDAERLKEWMVAATNSPQEYAGEANDPQNPDAVAWYRAMHGVQAPPRMVDHDCPVEGPMVIEAGKPCNWCDQLDDKE